MPMFRKENHAKEDADIGCAKLQLGALPHHEHHEQGLRV